MLRINRRWHDAANGPLSWREARLLWFAAPPAPASPTPPPNDPEEDTKNEESSAPNNNADATGGMQDTTSRRMSVEQNWNRRQAERVLLPTEADTTLKANDVLGRLMSLQQELEQQQEIFQELDTLVQHVGVSESQRKEVEENKEIVTQHIARIRSQAYALDHLALAKWQSGELTPNEFLQRYKRYVEEMRGIDEMNTELEIKNYRASGRWDRTRADITLDNQRREEARQNIMRDVEAAVRKAEKTLPTNLAAENDQRVAQMDDATRWSHYNKSEKDQIIREISTVAGFDIILTSVNDDVMSVTEKMEEKKLKENTQKMQRTLMELHAKKTDRGAKSDEGTSSGNGIADVWNTAYSSLKTMNDSLGIEWLTAYEWMEAFGEVWESVKELRKQKSRLRVSSGASRIAQLASFVPGFGGKALTNLLEQQQEAKNEEIKSSFLKELKNNRIDLGFEDIFGKPGEKQGELAYYYQLGDTNRTQAILEFAADKAMLYGMSKKSWDTYVLPGNIPFRSLLPRNWSDKQVDNWFSNLGFRNKQGEDGQIKAGETLASGRSTFNEYTGLFKSAVNGMSLWFAKGVANASLKKVKNGHMSATLMLIVADAWEHNPLFRKYAYLEKDWWDRLAGDSKPMRIGMSKYDQGHLIKGLEVGETDIAKADVNVSETDPNKPKGTQRVGPLIAAMRRYLIAKDGSLAQNPEKLLEYTAKLWSLNVIKLENGKEATYYSPELLPYHIKYMPDEMREANVEALGDDFFIERSEVIDTTAEVVQYVGAIRDYGFAYPTKARYFFSHIIDAYDDMNKRSKKPGAEGREFAIAAQNFQAKMRGNLDTWIARALRSGTGSTKLLTEEHKDQDKRLIVKTLVEKGLISRGVIEQLESEGVPAAKMLMKQLHHSNHQIKHSKQTGTDTNTGTNMPSTAA